MTLIAGIDGCRGGWFLVEGDTENATVQGSVCGSFADVLTRIPAPTVIAVDIPIGLHSLGARSCDEAARQLLRPRRSSSVFPAPIRPVLDAATHKAASECRRGVEGKGMSIQAFAITGKVKEVDSALRSAPEHASRVFEVHPEVSFAMLNGAQPLTHAKKRAIGRAERLALLSSHFGDTPQRLIDGRSKGLVAADDVLDALVALWTAQRIVRGTAVSLPPVPERDEVGLPMAIFY
jgi:predicted RNase H-like nuclease